eukprot:740518-Amphidinium_carterae.1
MAGAFTQRQGNMYRPTEAEASELKGEQNLMLSKLFGLVLFANLFEPSSKKALNRTLIWCSPQNRLPCSSLKSIATITSISIGKVNIKERSFNTN